MSILDTDTENPSLLHRRKFLAGIGVGAAAVALAACGGDDDDSSSDTTTTEGGDEETTTTAGGDEETTTTEAEGDGSETDLAIAQLAAGLEVLAVNTYQAVADAAGSGAVGEVPPAVVEYVTTALDHHQQHLDSWNGIITGSGEAEVTEPNADLDPTVQEALGGVTDVVGAAELALMLEGIAAATYLDALTMLTNPEVIEQTGSMFIVDRQHMALLTYALGEYPIPDTFASTDDSVA